MSVRHDKTSLQSLITLERAQKLDLLIHLISNLSQSLVVCGPNGIGKTRLLETLKENNKDHWPICMIQGSSALSFESILENFSHQLLQIEPKFTGQDLSSILSQYQKNNRKVVLIIDDAGLMVPGLISALIEYANTISGLRLVLTLTHDELHIKSRSDRIIDECHFIEIPPLNKKQCMIFLQNLSAQPGAAISFNAVTDGLVENLYRVTHGIPGKIVSELPRLSDYRVKTKAKWGIPFVVLVGVFAAGYLFYAYKPSQHRIVEKPEISHRQEPVLRDFTEPTASTKIDVPEIVDITNPQQDDNVKQPPLVSMPILKEGESSNQDEIVEQPDIQIKPPVLSGEQELPNDQIRETEEVMIAEQETEESIRPKAKVVIPLETETAPLEAVQQNPEKEEQKITLGQNPKDNQMDDAEWVRAQNAGNYTLQLMVLSKRESVNKLLNKYSKYKEGIKFFQLNNKDRSKYILIYGSFPTFAEAEKKKKALPAELRKAWTRKFKMIQKSL